MFVSFLAAPTVVSLIEDEADVSMVYSLTEEEIQKELKEIKAGPETEFQFAFVDLRKNTSKINSENLLRHDNAFGDIFSPPPEI